MLIQGIMIKIEIIVEREETDLSRKMKKEICKVIYNIIPNGQAMQITTNADYGTNIAVLIVYATIEIIIINKIGIYFFNKKEIS
jgi:RNase P subunit RPR2